MKHAPSLILASVLVLVAGQASRAPAAPRPQDAADWSQSDFDRFIRIRKNDRNKPLALQTSITRYEGTNASGERVAVDLIGVVHIGEEAYYAQLNERFQPYDAVLYELVAPEGTRIPKGGRMDDELNPLAALQKGMQTALGLQFQLDHVDYTRDNFVHADMTPEEFFESMKANDESVGKMLLRAIGQSMAMQASGSFSEVDLLMTVFSSDPALRLRQIFAREMKNMEGGMIIFQGRDGSTIITHRNRKALGVLRGQLETGKTRVAIFYGAGHMPDMERHLMSDFQMKRGGQVWLDAWNLKSR